MQVRGQCRGERVVVVEMAAALAEGFGGGGAQRTQRCTVSAAGAISVGGSTG